MTSPFRHAVASAAALAGGVVLALTLDPTLAAVSAGLAA